MNKGRFFLYIVSIILSGTYFLASGAAVSANYQKQQPKNSYKSQQYDSHSTKNKKESDKKNKGSNDKNYCSVHPTDPKCCPPISVPEFGLIPGILATVTSAGFFLVIRKKSVI